MENLHGIVVFLRVVEAGSLSAAARGMGVSTSAVSAALARLEDGLATRLVNRTTRRLSVTEEGREFYDRCKKIISDLEAAELTVSKAGRVPSGALKVGIPSALGRKWIVPRLAEFVDAFPSVELEIISTDFVPYTMDDGLDICVQIGELHDSSLAVRRLACSEYLVCASPDFLEKHGTPQSPADLAEYSCLMYRRPRNGRMWDWRFNFGNGVEHVTVEPLLTMNSHEALVSGAEAGLGIIQVADYYAHPSMERGHLVEILRDFKTEGHIISAVFSRQKPFPPKVRVFVDFLAKQFDRPPWTTNTQVTPKKDGNGTAGTRQQSTDKTKRVAGRRGSGKAPSAHGRKRSARA